MKIYCIYDKLAQEGGPLFEAKNDGIALRMYQGIQLPGNPEDFKILWVGDYSHDPVKITAITPPVEVNMMTKVEDE